MKVTFENGRSQVNRKISITAKHAKPMQRTQRLSPTFLTPALLTLCQIENVSLSSCNWLITAVCPIYL